MNFAQARSNMLKQQCRTWEVTNEAILTLLNETPREYFVPRNYQNFALADWAIPLAHQQFMWMPAEEARALDALAIERHEQVLEIGTGSGYLTALLAKQAKHVESIDIFADLTETAARKLTQYGLTNVTLHTADMSKGHDEAQTYDVIVITGALTTLPKNYLALLTTGGRLFAILGNSPRMQAVCVTKVDAVTFQQAFLFETYVLPLLNMPLPSSFIF